MSKPMIGRTLLIASLALNLFLVGFVAGRFTGPGFMPRGPHHGPMGGPPGMDMPPPPFFGPSELFGPSEMHAQNKLITQHFEKMGDARRAFGDKLKTGPVSKADVLAHFHEVDAEMEQVRNLTQQKAAEKISTMSAEDRAHFADRLLERGPEDRK